MTNSQSPDRAALADELLPCPFCGGKAAMCVLEDSPGDIISAWVNCSCGMETHERRTEAEAAEKWNTRSPSPYSGAEKSVDEIAAEVTEEIRCEERARERVAKADEVSGDVYLLKVLLSVIASQTAALRAYEAMHPTTLPRDAERESDEVLAQEIHRVAGCQVGSERCKNIIRWYRGKLAQRGPRDAERETIERIFAGYADSYRMMTNDGDGKVLCSSVRTDLLCNIKPAVLSALPSIPPREGVTCNPK